MLHCTFILMASRSALARELTIQFERGDLNLSWVDDAAEAAMAYLNMDMFEYEELLESGLPPYVFNDLVAYEFEKTRLQ